MSYQTTGNGLFGDYRGLVLRHETHGKCKIWIPGVYPEEFQNQPDKLPSAEQVTPLFGGSNKGNGVFSYPNVGSVVVCRFWNGDSNYPFFYGSVLGGDNGLAQYDEVRPCPSAGPEDDAYIHKITVDQSTIKIWESGHIEIETYSDKSKTDSSKIILDGQGNINIESTQTISLHAPNIKMEADNQIDVVTPKFLNINSVSNIVQSPSITSDSSTGMTTIKGKRHSQIFN